MQCTSSSLFQSLAALNVHRFATQYAVSIHKFATCHLVCTYFVYIYINYTIIYINSFIIS